MRKSLFNLNLRMLATIFMLLANVPFVASRTVEVTTTMWSGSQTVEGWSGAQVFSASACAGIKAGDRIVVTCTKALSTSQSQVDLRNGAGWSNFTPALNINITNKTFPYDAVFTITESVAEAIKANGMVVTGKDFVFTRVAHVTDREVSPSTEKGDYARTVWEGNEPISWVSGSNNSVLIKNAELGELNADDVVRVYYKDMKPGSVGRLLANWTVLKSITNATLLGSRYYEYTLSDEWIEQLKSASGLRISGNNYTATKVEIIDPAKKYLLVSETDMQDIRAWKADEQPKVSINIQNFEDVDVEALVEVDIDHDMYTDYTELSQTVAVAAGKSVPLTIPFNLEAGFYNLNIYVNGDNICSYVIGSRPEEVLSAPDDNLEEIKAYWQKELDILSQIPIEAELTLIESASTSNRNVYLVKMKSTPDTYGGEPVEIRGFYAEPVKPGRYPAIIQYQGTDGGTSTIKPIGGDDNIGWCELVISTRGQMLNNRNTEDCEWAWLDPSYTRSDKGGIDYYAHGFGDLERHYYRGANIDCIRAIDFMASREKVHLDNIFAVGGSQGGSFVYVAAALGGGRIKAAAPSITGHSDFPDCVKIVSWPGNVFAAQQAALGMPDDDMWHFLSYFDVKNLATMVNCPVITSFSLQDRTDPPHINVAPFNNVNRNGLTDDDFKYVVNPFLGHGTASDWKNTYMAFFEKYRSDQEPFDPIVPVITVWKGSEVIDWNTGDTNNWVSVPASEFKNVSAGNILRICFSNVTKGAQGHICQGNWSDLADATDYIPLSGASFSFTVTEAMLDQLKRNGLIVTGTGFTLDIVEVVLPENMPNVKAEIATNSICVWEDCETPCITVTLVNNENSDLNVEVSLGLRTDDFQAQPGMNKTVEIGAGETAETIFELPSLLPGFYHAVVTANHAELGDFNFGFDITGIESQPDMESDFDDFWDNTLRELSEVPLNANLTLIPEKSTNSRNVYLLEMSSISDNENGEPVTIRGYYAEPVANGKYPVLITYQGYDSDKETTPWCPGGNDRPEYIELILSTRGQMLNNRAPYTNTYGDWFLYCLGEKDKYYYRGAYMDAVRAIDFVTSREKADTENIFAQGQSQGGALTLAAAALGKGRLKAIAPSIPFMGDFPDYFNIGNWPSYNVRNYQKEKGFTDEQILKSLSYFDTKNLATKIDCPVKMVFGLQDDVCPPHTNIAPYNNLASENKYLSYNAMLKHQTHQSWDKEFMDFFNDICKGTTGVIDCVGETSRTYNVMVYSIHGSLVYTGPAKENPSLPSGIYLIKSGGKTSKIYVK